MTAAALISPFMNNHCLINTSSRAIINDDDDEIITMNNRSVLYCHRRDGGMDAEQNVNNEHESSSAGYGTEQNIGDVIHCASAGYDTEQNIGGVIHCASAGYDTEQNIGGIVHYASAGCDTEQNIGGVIHCAGVGYDTEQNVSGVIYCASAGYDTEQNVSGVIYCASAGYDAEQNVSDAIHCASAGYDTEQNVRGVIHSVGAGYDTEQNVSGVINCDCTGYDMEQNVNGVTHCDSTEYHLGQNDMETCRSTSNVNGIRRRATVSYCTEIVSDVRHCVDTGHDMEKNAKGRHLCADSGYDTECVVAVKDTTTGSAAIEPRKRPFPFMDSAMRILSSKLIRLDPHPGPSGAVITCDLKDKNAGIQGDSSGVAMPVDDRNDDTNQITNVQNKKPVGHFSDVSTCQCEPFPVVASPASFTGVFDLNDDEDNQLSDIFDPEPPMETQGQRWKVGTHHSVEYESPYSVLREVDSIKCRCNRNGFISNASVECRNIRDVENAGVKDIVGALSATVETTRTVEDGATLSRRVKQLSKQWRRLLKDVNGFILVLNSDLTINLVTANVIGHLGFHQNEMNGRAVQVFLHPSCLSLVDYIKNGLSRYKDGRPLGSSHSVPVRLRFKKGHNSGYMTVRWYQGVLLSAMPGASTCDESVIVSVCVPVIPTCSLLPNKMELMMLRRLRHWTVFYCGGSKWAFHPFGIASKNRMRSSEMDRCFPCLKSLLRAGCTVYKTSRSTSDLRIWCATCTDTGTFLGGMLNCLVCRSDVSRLDKTKYSSGPSNQDVSSSHSTNKCLDRKIHNHQLPDIVLVKLLHPRTRLAKSRKHRNVKWCHKRNANKIKQDKSMTDLEATLGIQNDGGNHFSNISNFESVGFSHRDNPYNKEFDSLKAYLYTSNKPQNHCIDNESDDILHQTLPTSSQQVPTKCQNVMEQIDTTENMFHQIPQPQPSNHLDTLRQHRTRLLSQLQAPSLDGCTLSTLSNPPTTFENIQDQNISHFPLNYRSQNFNVVDLTEIDLAPEYSFQSGDAVMPVEGELDCMSDLVLNNSSSNVTNISSNNSNVSEQGLDPFMSQFSNDFTYSFENELQTDDFQTFDHMLNFSSSNTTPSSVCVTSLNSTNGFSDRSTEITDCSNKLLMEIDDVVPANKNPFQKPSQPSHPSLSPLKESLITSMIRKENGRSLLRSLLNKDEVEGQASTTKKSRQHHQSQLLTFPSSNCRPESYLKSKTATQTKELPVPKSRPSKPTHVYPPPPTQELPRPSPLPPIPFNSFVASPPPLNSSDAHRNEQEERLNSDEIFLSSVSDGNKFPSLSSNSDTTMAADKDDCINDIFVDNDPLPDDVVELAMEYCNSLDNKQVESLITELDEHFGLLENLDSINPTNSANNLNQTLFSLKRNSIQQLLQAHSLQLETKNYNHPQNYLTSPLFSPSLKNITSEITTHSSSSNAPSPSANKMNVSLLRQAVTSPDVDKLIEKIPLARKLLSEKYRPNHTITPNSNKTCVNSHDRTVGNNSENILQQKDINNRPCQLSNKLHCDKRPNPSKQCISNFTADNLPQKTSAVSHISISVPPSSPKKSSNTKQPVTPIKLKISTSSGMNKRKVYSTKTGSVCQSKTPKSSICPNSSSQPVSVMVMRKENHRSRKSKTIATQTDNQPDEVYPELELSDTDVILTPSVYLDTTHSLLAGKPPATGNKSQSHNCHVFSSSIRSLASPRDSKEMTIPSPSHASPSSCSSSTVSELELHLRGWSGPDSNLSSPLSCESEASSDIPFLQRLLTGELSKDKYEKLDKDLLEKQRSGSTSSLSPS